MNLLTEKEYDSIRRALDQGREITIYREMRDYRIIVETLPAPEVWHVPMLIRVQQWRRRDAEGHWLGHMYTTQNFPGVEEMRRILKTEEVLI